MLLLVYEKMLRRGRELASRRDDHARRRLRGRRRLGCLTSRALHLALLLATSLVCLHACGGVASLLGETRVLNALLALEDRSTLREHGRGMHLLLPLLLLLAEARVHECVLDQVRCLILIHGLERLPEEEPKVTAGRDLACKRGGNLLALDNHLLVIVAHQLNALGTEVGRSCVWGDLALSNAAGRLRRSSARCGGRCTERGPPFERCESLRIGLNLESGRVLLLHAQLLPRARVPAPEQPVGARAYVELAAATAHLQRRLAGHLPRLAHGTCISMAELAEPAKAPGEDLTGFCDACRELVPR